MAVQQPCFQGGSFALLLHTAHLVRVEFGWQGMQQQVLHLPQITLMFFDTIALTDEHCPAWTHAKLQHTGPGAAGRLWRNE